MRVAVIGGGPGGLYFAALAKQLSPHWEVTVWERNAPDDTFGFGVVFSDETLDGIAQADPGVYAAMSAESARWSDIDVRYRGEVLTSGGHGFAALGRRRLLRILQERCAALGVDVRHRTQAPPVGELAAAYDLVVACDGVRSAGRAAYADTFGPDLDERHCRYMWLGTDKVFEAFTFIVEERDFGTVQVHAYPYDDTRSTFIVEIDEAAWRRAGLDVFADRERPAGDSDEDSIRWCEELLAGHLDGHRLLPNNSRWIRFTTVRNRTWRHGNVVLLGDAAHTAHFSIGSGTKLAMEDALALAACLNEHPDVPSALAAYEAERKPVVESTQRAAQASLEWFENVHRYTGQHPRQFAFNLLTRSRRVTYDNLRARDARFTTAVDSWHAAQSGMPAAPGTAAGVPTDAAPGTAADTAPGTAADTVPGTAAGPAAATAVPPMFRPFRLGGLRLRNRVVVPPVALYTARDGVPGDFDLVHLSTQALGGSALVLAGMTAVSADGRATTGCPGLYTDAQEAAWRRITDFVHGQSDTCLGIQLTHAGRRAAGPPLLAASALAWEEGGPAPREATRADMDAVAADFVRAAERAHRAGFDAIELQYGHGHLLSGFLSPLTNLREDAYGGDLDGRLRFPLEVLRAVRAVWPAAKALIVRISATDWAEGGTTPADAVALARALADAGADAVDVSTGEVVAHERPALGRSYQTPYADLIRNATGIPTLAVGAISSYDDVNSIILAGRADLCAVGRAQLHDPLWTLHAAAAQGYRGPAAPWAPSWRAGSATPPAARTDRVPPRLHLLRRAAVPVHRRWTPHLPASAPAAATR
ncbi:FAD-dependent monooxygenase [Streptomyces sp. NPDC090022]|uniref:oxidoreductase n=1 Tax=Streptomyces sp. NPDC090022 TaxID=3365920 RepID=UPI00381FD88D